MTTTEMKERMGKFGTGHWKNPDWERTWQCHDWRNHVGEDVKKIWHSFTDRQKLTIACWADDMAMNEEWE